MYISSKISLGTCPSGYYFDGILRADWVRAGILGIHPFSRSTRRLTVLILSCVWRILFTSWESLAFSLDLVVDLTLSFQRFSLDLSSCMKKLANGSSYCQCNWQNRSWNFWSKFCIWVSDFLLCERHACKTPTPILIVSELECDFMRIEIGGSVQELYSDSEGNLELAIWYLWVGLVLWDETRFGGSEWWLDMQGLNCRRWCRQ